jgi:hypothetical protein
MRFALSPQPAQSAQHEARRTILPFAAETPTPAVIELGPTAGKPSRAVGAGGADPLFIQPISSPVPPNPEAPQAPRMGIPDAAARGIDLLNQVGRQSLAPNLAFENFVTGLGSMNISRAALAKLTETFAVSLKNVSATQRRQPKKPPAPAPVLSVATPNSDFTDRVRDVASQTATGFNIGLANGLGAPVDLVTLGLKLMSQGIKAAGGVDIDEIEDPFLGSQQIQKLMNEAGAVAPPSDDPTGQIARRVGEGIGSTVGPVSGVLRGVPALLKALGPSAIPLLRQIARAPGRFFAAELGAGATSGGGAAIANQLAPGSVAAELVGETLGGFAGAGVAAGTARAVRRAAIVRAVSENPLRLMPDGNRWTRKILFEQLFDGGRPTNPGGLRKNILKDPTLNLENTDDWVAHHIVPWTLRSHHLVRRLGMNLNHSNNGVDLPSGAGGPNEASAHFGFHPEYTRAYRYFLHRLDWAPITESQKKVLLAESVVRVRRRLKKGRLALAPESDNLSVEWASYFGTLADEMGLPFRPVDD